jgi:hypothetical protein
MKMSGARSEKLMELLFNCILYGGIETLVEGLNSESSVLM